jgi:diadenosine tetraphosphate (Ap4A) HIT family hydrolase
LFSVVLGNVNGQFRQVLAKLTQLHQKQQFAFGLVVGDFFADPATATNDDEQNLQLLLGGDVAVPFPIYFALGTQPLPLPVMERLKSKDDEDLPELCSNLTFLGKCTKFTTSEGVRIVALGGTLDQTVIAGLSKDKFTPLYTTSDVDFLKGADSTDILITSEWPTAIRTRSAVAFGGDEPVSQQCLADLCVALKPRYYFSSTSEAPYTREPFCYDKKPEENGFRVTRFVSLSKYVEGKPVKGFLAAYSLDPKTPLVKDLPSGTTLSPFLPIEKKRPLPDNGESAGLVHYSEHGNRRGNKRRRGGGRAPLSEKDCFFCLANTGTAAHLIVSIGEHAYLTTARGPLPKPSSFPNLGFLGHLLIIPLAHQPTLSVMQEEERMNTYGEMQKYRSALNEMVKKAGEGEYGSVTWELSMGRLMHIHWQYLPIPTKLIREGAVENALMKGANDLSYPSFVSEDIADGSHETSDFFRVILWDPIANEDKSLVVRFNEDTRFHIQFGREVMSQVLHLSGRVDWMECRQSEEEEMADAALVTQAFKDFDFTG